MSPLYLATYSEAEPVPPRITGRAVHEERARLIPGSEACLAAAMSGSRSRESQYERAGDALSIRIDLADGGRVGPGKIAVLEEIARTGSISAAGRALGMSYRRTWMLVEELNLALGKPVVETVAGGAGGGGSRLTEAGEAVVACYRAIEAESAVVAGKHLKTLSRVFDRK